MVLYQKLILGSEEACREDRAEGKLMRTALGLLMGWATYETLNANPYLEGHGDLITRLTMGIIGVTMWVIGVINLLSKSP